VCVRVRVWLPPLQDLLQLAYEPHAATTQSTAHWLVLQSLVSRLTGHALPPWLGATCVRARVWLPPPHDLLQLAYEPHAPTAQSTGQLLALQSLTSLVTGHALPPWLGDTCVRARVWLPPPHDWLQLA
jgi:hypothetical protein